MKKFKKIIIIALVSLSAFTIIKVVSAESPTDLLKATANVANYQTDPSRGTLIPIIVNIIKIALSLIGILYLVLTLYAGYMWMMSGGEPEKIKKATNMLKNSVIGLVIILSSYAITQFVISKIFQATTNTTGRF